VGALAVTATRSVVRQAALETKGGGICRPWPFNSSGRWHQIAVLQLPKSNNLAFGVELV
jgi:hypothetical protein